MKKLLIAENERHARQLMLDLELDPEQWHAVGIGSRLTGRRFSKMVDLSERPTSEADAQRRQSWLYMARSHLVF